MSIVRFKFYANGHTKPFTGHMYLSRDGGTKWKLVSNHLRVKEITTLEGDEIYKGGAAFLEEMHHFIAYWATAQADAIEKHRVWSSHKQPQQKLVRPGFRAVTAAKQWHDYKRDIEAEITLIKQDYNKAQEELFTQEWLPSPDLTPFPVFAFGDPWNVKLDMPAKSAP